MSNNEPTGFDLLTDHRLKALEKMVHEDHRATEQLRIDLVEYRASSEARAEARAKMYATIISVVISLIGVIAPHLF